jgi:hypothetical protein
MSRTGDETGRDDLLAALLPPAIEVLTAWSVAEDGDPAEFTAAMDRVINDVTTSPDPRKALARLMFGQTSLAGVLLDEIAELTGSSREDVLQAVHRRYVGNQTSS